MKEDSREVDRSSIVRDLHDSAAGSECDDGSKGSILRLKRGYNPNSSSMGSIVFALPAAMLGITSGFGVVSGLILAAFGREAECRCRDSKSSDSSSKAEESQGLEGY